LKLQAILERCRRATDRRNDLMHGIWAQEVDGQPMRSGSDNSWYPLPTVTDLKALAYEIQTLTDQLNKARLEGFLLEAIASRRPAS
jgi:hypothetical protein